MQHAFSSAGASYWNLRSAIVHGEAPQVGCVSRGGGAWPHASSQRRLLGRTAQLHSVLVRAARRACDRRQCTPRLGRSLHKDPAQRWTAGALLVRSRPAPLSHARAQRHPFLGCTGDSAPTIIGPNLRDLTEPLSAPERPKCVGCAWPQPSLEAALAEPDAVLRVVAKRLFLRQPGERKYPEPPASHSDEQKQLLTMLADCFGVEPSLVVERFHAILSAAIKDIVRRGSPLVRNTRTGEEDSGRGRTGDRAAAREPSVPTDAVRQSPAHSHAHTCARLHTPWVSHNPQRTHRTCPRG